jgi:quercetin dioxygenase-like cupin family protein
MSTLNLLRLLVIGALLCGPLGSAIVAADPPGTATTAAGRVAVQQLLLQNLPEIPGKEVLMLTVTTPPGGASAAHRHDAEVYVYMLEGSMVMQVDGAAPVTLRPGDTFHESPTDIHRQSANASKTRPAKFLVFMIKEKGKPVTLPVAQSSH